jgi:hypothetical protein
MHLKHIEGYHATHELASAHCWLHSHPATSALVVASLERQRVCLLRTPPRPQKLTHPKPHCVGIRLCSAGAGCRRAQAVQWRHPRKQQGRMWTAQSSGSVAAFDGGCNHRRRFVKYSAAERRLIGADRGCVTVPLLSRKSAKPPSCCSDGRPACYSAHGAPVCRASGLQATEVSAGGRGGILPFEQKASEHTVLLLPSAEVGAPRATALKVRPSAAPAACRRRR